MFTLRKISTGSNVPSEGDQFNQLIALAQGGRLQRACEEGRLFTANNATKVATSAGITTTWTGLAVSNPSGSGKNFIMHEFGFGQMLASDTIGAIGLQTASIAAPAKGITVYNALDGESNALSAAYADDGATLVSPLLKRIFASYDDAAAAGENPAPNIYNLNGSLVIPPGRTVATYTTLATTACYVFYFIWEEIAVIS